MKICFRNIFLNLETKRSLIFLFCGRRHVGRAEACKKCLRQMTYFLFQHSEADDKLKKMLVCFLVLRQCAVHTALTFFIASGDVYQLVSEKKKQIIVWGQKWKIKRKKIFHLCVIFFFWWLLFFAT